MKLLIVLLMWILGIGFLVFAAAQLTHIVPMLNAWSDLWSILMALICICIGHLTHVSHHHP